VLRGEAIASRARVLQAGQRRTIRPPSPTQGIWRQTSARGWSSNWASMAAVPPRPGPQLVGEQGMAAAQWGVMFRAGPTRSGGHLLGLGAVVRRSPEPFALDLRGVEMPTRPIRPPSCQGHAEVCGAGGSHQRQESTRSVGQGRDRLAPPHPVHLLHPAQVGGGGQRSDWACRHRPAVSPIHQPLTFPAHLGPVRQFNQQAVLG